MIDGSHQHVCDTSPSLLLLSPPNESTLNPRAQHVMMGRAPPNSACRGPTAVMEEWERCKCFFSEETILLSFLLKQWQLVHSMGLSKEG